MKITEEVVRDFERDQREYGTRVAIHNLVWDSLARQFDGLGVRTLKTVYYGRKVRGRYTRWS